MNWLDQNLDRRLGVQTPRTRSGEGTMNDWLDIHEWYGRFIYWPSLRLACRITGHRFERFPRVSRFTLSNIPATKFSWELPRMRCLRCARRVRHAEAI